MQFAELLRADPSFYCYQFLKAMEDVLDSLEKRDENLIKANGYSILHPEYLLIMQAANTALSRRSRAYQTILQQFIKATTPTSNIS